MRYRALGLCLLILAISGCTPTARLSGPVTRVDRLPEAGLRIGFVADSQLQTRSNYNRVFGYRDKLADFIVETAIRPPALDWAARSMLRSQLDQLRIQGAKAIFYLGDGANNGCYDELALGFQDRAAPGPNQQGVLALLDEFRTSAGIPVFFILGNHDVLGAGSSAFHEPRGDFCEATVSPNRSVAKFEAMKLTDSFNRGNAAFAGAWRYHSNWDAASLQSLCGTDASVQHRTRGCYLAATVDYAQGEKTAQFLLLDTNDWADVSGSTFAGFQQEGIRGAMSFRDDAKRQIVSQTTWFDGNASDRRDLRVGLSHYDVASLTKHLPVVGRVSAKTQMYMQLFTRPAGETVNEASQDLAYVVSGHTHVREIDGKLFTFKMDCGPILCARTNRFGIRELNVGSTTDYSNYATIAQFDFGKVPAGNLSYRRVESEPEGCDTIWTEVGDYRFPNALQGKDQGWAAIGIDRGNRHSYDRFVLADVQRLWANLDAYAGTDAHKANCIGLYAAAVEAGVDPSKRLPPKPKRRWGR